MMNNTNLDTLDIILFIAIHTLKMHNSHVHYTIEELFVNV